MAIVEQLGGNALCIVTPPPSRFPGPSTLADGDQLSPPTEREAITFRDWCAESTNFPGEVCEHALAHSLPDKVEAAYRRGDLLDKRVQLMKAWADYCAKPQAEASVTPISSKRKTAKRPA